MTKTRCSWAGDDPLMQQYHDNEWGRPVKDDRKLFEFLILEQFQAGLSWSTILKRREGFRKAFKNFDIDKIAKFTDKDRQRLLDDQGIIRNRLKVDNAINCAKIAKRLQKEHGSLAKYLWRFTSYKTLRNHPKTGRDIPATSKESDAMSKALKGEGMKFTGSVICYAFMQATGMVDDHTRDCIRRR